MNYPKSKKIISTLQKIIRTLIKINCTRTNVDTITFKAKNQGVLDIYEILNQINELWHACDTPGKIIFKLEFGDNLEIFTKINENDSWQKNNLPHLPLRINDKKRISKSVFIWLNFFIKAEIYCPDKFGINIKDIKEINFETSDIRKLLIYKINKICAKIKSFDNDINHDNLNNYFDLQEKECFNFFMYLFFKKTNKNITQTTNNLLLDKVWLSDNRFFNSFSSYLFDNEDINCFFDSIKEFMGLCNFLLKHNEWLNCCMDEDVSFKRWFDVCSVNTKEKKRNQNNNSENDFINCRVLNLFNLLKYLKNSYFSISYYQRNYVWTSELIQNLFNNILECKKDSYHYLNHVLVRRSVLSDSDPKGAFLFEIIDGQQRILSLIIIYVVCIKFAYHKKFQVNYDYLNFLSSDLDISKKIFYFPEKNNQTWLKNILKLDFKFLREKNKSPFTKNILNIVNNIEIEIKNQKEFELFLEKLMEKFIFSFTTIKLDSQINSIDIFETFKNLNSKGVQLNSLDLLNNYLFQKNIKDESVKHFLDIANKSKTQTTRKEFIDAQKEYETFKEYVNTLLQNRQNSEATIKTFNKTICKGGVNVELKDKFNPDLNINTNFKNLENIIEFNKEKESNDNLLNDLSIINKHFKKYLELFNEKYWTKTENKLIKDNLDYLITFSKKDVCKPFIYKLFESQEIFVKQKTHKAKLKWIRPILYILETYVVRNAIWQPGISYTKVYDYLLEELDKYIYKNTEFTYKELWKIIKEKSEIPTYKNIEDKFKSTKYKISDDNITKLVLAKLESVFQKGNFKIWDEYEDSTKNLLGKDYEIEHLIAKNDKTFEEQEQEHNDESSKDFILNVKETKEAIGNTILLDEKENKWVSNLKIFEKIRLIIKNSGKRNKRLLFAEIEYSSFREKFNEDEKKFVLDNFEGIENEENENEKLKNVILNRSKTILNWINLIWNYNAVEWIENINEVSTIN